MSILQILAISFLYVYLNLFGKNLHSFKLFLLMSDF